MGYGGFCWFWMVDFLFVGLVVFVGFCVVVVSMIFFVMVGIFVGVNNFGYLFMNGL